MAGAGLVPPAIVLALGAGALGGAEALRLLLQFAGRSAATDLGICVVVISLHTPALLGAMLLVRFVRKAGPGGGGAPATDLFAVVTAAVSVGTALLVTACFLVVPGDGLGGAVRLLMDFAVKNPTVVTVLATLAICTASAAAAAATGFLPCAVPLPRFLRGAGTVGGPAPAPAAPAKTIEVMFLLAVCLVASFLASGGFDAHVQLLFPESDWRTRMVTMPVGVAVVTVAGTTLLVRCSRRARNAAGAGGGAAARTS